MKRLLLFCLTCFLLVGVNVVLLKRTHPSEPPVNVSKTQVKQEVVPLITPAAINEEVNKERAKTGAKPLELDERLNQSAQLKADDMKQFKYYDHVNPTTGKHGYDYIKASGLSCRVGGENLTFGDDAKEVVLSWLGSNAHREAMLGSEVNLAGYGISGDYIVLHLCTLQ